MTPHWSYWHNHRFYFPSEVPNVTSAASTAAETGAAAATTSMGHNFHGQGPRWGYGWSHGHGQPFYPRRFGLFRRFFWFGLGATAAHYWIKKHNEYHSHHPELDNYWTRSPTPSIANNQQQQSSYVAPPTTNVSPPITSTPQMVSAEERRWRWHNRWHRNETTNGITQTDQASKTNQMGQETKKDKGETWEELDKLKGSFMALWEERRKAASEAQNQANERAREFAREKMDSLSATLEMLRQRLEKEDEEKRRVV